MSVYLLSLFLLQQKQHLVNAIESKIILNATYINKFIVLNPYKLLFCLIDKVGNTGFSRLFKAADMKRIG
jgi:hypothetical protein